MATQITVSKSRGKLGVTAIDSSDGMGAIVSGLVDGSVAKAAGLHVGDHVLNVNGCQLHGHRECIEAIDTAPDRVSFVLARKTREVCLDKAYGRIGITCTSTDGGVQCSALEEGSLALQCGLYVGDTLLSVNGQLVSSAQQSIDLIDGSPVVRLVVVAATRALVIDKRISGNLPVGITVADRVDGGAGVVVIGLQPGGIGIRQLRLGDTILSVDDVLVTNHASAIAAIDRADGHFRLVLGENAPDFHEVLSSVHQSTAAPPGHDEGLLPRDKQDLAGDGLGSGRSEEPLRNVNGSGQRF